MSQTKEADLEHIAQLAIQVCERVFKMFETYKETLLPSRNIDPVWPLLSIDEDTAEIGRAHV